MAVLTTSTATIQESAELSSSSSIREQQSELVHRYALELGSAFRYSAQLNSALFVFAQRFLQINRVALAHLLFGFNIAALQTLLIARELATMAVTALSQIARGAWNSKQSRRLRKKLEFEFFVLILGTGNGIILLVFWPGWILIGLVYLIYLLCSWAG
ncbi:unnamed protein product [Discula destructiva]